MPEGAIPTLGCCAALEMPHYDIVFIKLITDFKMESPDLTPSDLDIVYQRCLAEPFIDGGVQIAIFQRLGIEQRTNLLGVNVDEDCYPVPDSAIHQFAVHGGRYNRAAPQSHDEMRYFAAKIRIRLPDARRWCITSCQHIQPVGACGLASCDLAIGNQIQTLIPAVAQFEINPDQLIPQNRPIPFSSNTFREFTMKGLSFDTQPPSSPFCGVP